MHPELVDRPRKTLGTVHRGEWAWLAGHSGQSARHGLQIGLDVGGGRRPGAAGVARVGAGHTVAEVPLDPGQGGVAQPVGGDALAGHPGQPLAEAVSEGS